jgi:NADH-quinone oxidoreductase subunit I
MDGVWGTIELIADKCTSCMLCARECPDWCIHIDSHAEDAPAHEAGSIGARARTVHVLDHFAIDFGLCMYCGICVEVCPFDALQWSPTPTPPGFGPTDLLHGIGQLAPDT